MHWTYGSTYYDRQSRDAFADKILKEGKVGDIIALTMCFHYEPSGPYPDLSLFFRIVSITPARGLFNVCPQIVVENFNGIRYSNPWREIGIRWWEELFEDLEQTPEFYQRTFGGKYQPCHRNWTLYNESNGQRLKDLMLYEKKRREDARQNYLRAPEIARRMAIEEERKKQQNINAFNDAKNFFK